MQTGAFSLLEKETKELIERRFNFVFAWSVDNLLAKSGGNLIMISVGVSLKLLLFTRVES